MYSYLPKEKLESFIDTYYHELKELDGKVLIEGEYAILPKLFYKTFPFEDLKLKEESEDKYPRYNFKFTGNLRDNQKPIVESLRKYFIENKKLNGLLVATCGVGKTAISTMISCALKYKTIILVDNFTIGDEWLKSYANLTNIPKSKIGIVGGGKYEIDKPIIVATVQTIISKLQKNFEQTRKDFNDIGFVIVDESHTSSSSERFSQSMFAFRTENTLAVTATPPINELNKLLFENTFGKVLYEYKIYQMTPEIYFVNYDSNIKQLEGKFYYQSDAMRKIVYYNSIITQSKSYAKVIGAINSMIMKDSTRKVINIVSTTDEKNKASQANLLKNVLKKYNPARLYAKINEVNQDGTTKNIIAGIKKSGKGFSYDELTDLVLCFPLTGQIALEQVIGRILRSHPDKPNPRVWILTDTAFRGHFQAKKSKLKRLFREIYGDDIKIKEIDLG